MKNLKIKTLNDYSRLHILPMNREVKSTHVEKLLKSVRKIGVLRPVIVANTACIDGVKKNWIIDGQHLCSALQREGLPIPYTEIEVESTEDLVDSMALLNTSSKAWNLLDFVNAYKYYNPDYAKLIKYINMYNLEPSMIAMIALNKVTHHGVGSIIKKGDFSIKNKNTEAMCKSFSDIFVKIGRADRFIKFNFLSVFVEKYGQFDQQKVLTNIEKHITTIRAMGDTDLSKEYLKSKIFSN